MFYLALACHQLSQLVMIKGLPEYVTSYVHKRVDKDIGQLGVFELQEDNGWWISRQNPFSYTGTRAAHGNPYGFASRWSGQWIIHGEKGDLKRDGGRITIFKNGQVVGDSFLKDLDNNLLLDEEIQFLKFFDMIKFSRSKKNPFKKFYEDSIDTWILMEACNESAKLNKKISVKNFKRKILS